MSFSERMFYFQSAIQSEDEDRERWARNAERSEQMEKRYIEDQRRRAAEYAERQRTSALEDRHRVALLFLKRLPFDRVATTYEDVLKAVGNNVLTWTPRDDDEWDRRRYRLSQRKTSQSVAARIMDNRQVFDDGITYPEIEVIAKHLAGLDRLAGWHEYLSLPHVMIAEGIYQHLTNFERYGPPQRPEK